jgi:hypothetical protein
MKCPALPITHPVNNNWTLPIRRSSIHSTIQQYFIHIIFASSDSGRTGSIFCRQVGPTDPHCVRNFALCLSCLKQVTAYHKVSSPRCTLLLLLLNSPLF